VVCVHHFDKWWRHSEAWERYDYSHSDEELIEWVPKIGRLDEKSPLTTEVGHRDARYWMVGLYSLR
jgi:hypothetical protein